MSRYIAKKVALSIMKECKQPGCGCFTQNGYYIQYQNGNVDSMLFVCGSCYDEYFKSTCSTGDFDEEQYIVRTNTQRYQLINPLLRDMICWTRKTAKVMRVTMVAVSLILVIAFLIKEHPDIRKEISAPQLHININTDIYAAVRNPEHLDVRTEAIANQRTKIFTHGGKGNDQ